MSTTKYLAFLEIALQEAEKCIPSPTAFCVGCVLVTRLPSSPDSPVILAKGYSRELTGNTHAEANAITKAKKLSKEELEAIFPQPRPLDIADILRHTDVYTTMEPCSIRTSGLAPCADLLIANKIRTCFIGVGEPDDFVLCEGARKLRDAGVEVIWLEGLQERCLAVARQGR